MKEILLALCLVLAGTEGAGGGWLNKEPRLEMPVSAGTVFAVEGKADGAEAAVQGKRRPLVQGKRRPLVQRQRMVAVQGKRRPLVQEQRLPWKQIQKPFPDRRFLPPAQF